MFYKVTTFSLNSDNFEILDDSLLKTAAIKLPDGIKYDSDFFYMVVKAVSAGEYYGSNKNADYFPEEELKKQYKTFLNAHFFKNHENKDVSKAIGDVLDAQWDDKMKYVRLLIRVDRKLAPTIVRGFEKGFMTDVSMGCRIKHSICSYCGNKAKVRSEYCTHIRNMKNQVLDDGTKIFEINIEPKFHDISAVLNGAEKTAKVLDIKLAESYNDANIKKVASIKENFINDGIEKVASDNVSKVLIDNLEIFPEKTASTKKEYLQKIADIKKEIVGRVVNSAEGEALLERKKNIEDLRKTLKLFYDKYWDKDKCVEIANNIKSVAIKRELPLRDAFDQFLKVLNFAGIELTPLEFNDIFNTLIGSSASDFREQFKDIDIPDNCIDIADENIVRDDMGKLINFPSVFDTINERIIPDMDYISNVVKDSPRPLSKVKAIIVTIKKKVPQINNDIAYNDMMDFVKDEMPQRSMHPRFLLDRISNLGDPVNNAPHFLPATFNSGNSSCIGKFLKYIIPSLLYSTYQGDRIRHLASDNFAYGLEKFASYIEGDTIDNLTNEFIQEKNASILGKGYTTRKALAYGLPLTFGYSAAQRARIKNKENVSGFNRYIAENPANAYVLQALGPTVAGKIGKGGTDIAKKIMDTATKAYKKVASENIFKNDNIDNMLKEKYTDSQIGIIKCACLLTELKRQDISDEILSINKLSEEDINEFLNICKKALKLEIDNIIEKIAGVGNLAKDVASWSLFTKPKHSALAAVPSNLIDASIFAYIGHKLTKKPKSNEIKDNIIKS